MTLPHIPHKTVVIATTSLHYPKFLHDIPEVLVKSFQDIPNSTFIRQVTERNSIATTSMSNAVRTAKRAV